MMTQSYGRLNNGKGRYYIWNCGRIIEHETEWVKFIIYIPLIIIREKMAAIRRQMLLRLMAFAIFSCMFLALYELWLIGRGIYRVCTKVSYCTQNS